MDKAPQKKCPHFSETKFIDPNTLQFFSYRGLLNIPEYPELNELLSAFEGIQIIETIKEEHKNDSLEFPPYLCLSCGEKMKLKEDFLTHHKKNPTHNILINLVNLNIVCYECNKINENGEVTFKINIINSNEDIEKIKLHIQYLTENRYGKPFNKYYTKEEIYSIKYKKLIENLKQKKFKKIIFMVGAGISTSAGVPDFRSETGLFKQLQDKYHLSSPEEFFDKNTFLRNPNYFYEFCKIFDLSEIKPTLTHKFLNYFIQKNNAKYLFTQNIDGLEIKAKIPENKIIFAHGNFLKGHCPKCNKNIDINIINNGIQKNEIVYCDSCKNVPCKPNVVFYGEMLPKRFYEKMEDIIDCDLVIIMGTSLKVYPFAGIPENMDNKAWKVVMNYDKVGSYNYDLLCSNSIFIEGKTDDTVLKLLKDIDLEDDFKKFIKDVYGDEEIIKTEEAMISV